jgi:hypothetical protein
VKRDEWGFKVPDFKEDIESVKKDAKNVKAFFSAPWAKSKPQSLDGCGDARGHVDSGRRGGLEMGTPTGIVLVQMYILLSSC